MKWSPSAKWYANASRQPNYKSRDALYRAITGSGFGVNREYENINPPVTYPYNNFRAVIESCTMSPITPAGYAPAVTSVPPPTNAFNFQLFSAVPCTGM